ncbi:MAG TPA: sulfatase-like hydrolase/transferase [bacterium]|nr:sulfatase-like hydrolase/transferase [bacterium]
MDNRTKCTTRREFLKRTAFAISAATFGAPVVLRSRSLATQGRGSRRPNIVLLYSDDHTWTDLGCFGNTEIHTPNIDSIAADGIKLTNFYAASSVCTPCRSGLLTGRYPHRNGLYENIRNNMVNYNHQYTELEYCFGPEMTQGLDVREVTIAQALNDGGYRTGIFGKWDSGRAPQYLPLQRGFDDFYGFCNTGIDYYTHERYGMPSLFRGNRRITEEGYATDLFKREAIRFIEENKDEPFFLYVPFNAPYGASNHDVQGAQAPPEYIRMYGELPGTRRQRYMAAITCMDDAIGAILEKLAQSGLEEETLVMFTADQGAGSNDPLRGGKGNFYEGGIRTPFVAKWPGHIPAGAVSDEFCSTLDLFPTFLSVAETQPPENIILDGYDILPVLTELGESMRNKQFWELRGKRGARIGQWKWVLDTEDRWVFPDDETGQLFDLSTDKEEQHNLATERPDVLKAIKAEWDNWMIEMAAAEPRGPFSKAYFDKLGYGNGNYRLW